MRITFLLPALLAAGCFNPTFDEPTCDPGGACPEGLTCIGGVCQVPSSDPDAAADDCYREANEAGNDNGAEATAIVIGAGASRVCGEFADRAPAGGVIDTDRYQIDGGGQPLVARIIATGASDYDQVALALGMSQIVVDSDPDEVISPAPAGTIELAVQAAHPSQLGRAVPYELVVEPADPDDLCIVEGPADQGEMLDNAANANTGNDVLENLLQGAPTLTPSTADMPEQVTQVLDVGTRLKIAGLVVNTPTQADMYKDRDTFQITTGPATTEVTVSLTWPEDTTTTTDDVDVDYYFITTDSLQPIAAGVQIGFGTYEFGVVPVAPSTSYYVLVASWMDAQADKAYELVLCANNP